jgi:glycosyltransferase involved in cell wall biosynthesis
LIHAIGLLRVEGIPIQLHLVGGGDLQSLSWMGKAIKRNDIECEFIFVHGSMSYEEGLEWYSKVDMFVFPPNHKK